jgi:phytoene dehydrogenase-like protein
MWGACPTLFDPTQAPPGKHTAFMWEELPYRLHGDPAHWDREKEKHARGMLELWAEYAPNMREGDLLVGAFAHGQIGYDRPFPGAGHYRGPVEGLYLCGSSSHPGGNVTGLAGYNCAQVLLKDLGIDTRWFGSGSSPPGV